MCAPTSSSLPSYVNPLYAYRIFTFRNLCVCVHYILHNQIDCTLAINYFYLLKSSRPTQHIVPIVVLFIRTPAFLLNSGQQATVFTRVFFSSCDFTRLPPRSVFIPTDMIFTRFGVFVLGSVANLKIGTVQLMVMCV